MIKRSMFFRLLLIYVCTVLISLGVVGFTLSYVTETYITNSKKEDMVRKAKKVNLAIRDFPHMPDDVKAMLVFLDQAFDSRIWVFDEQGQIIASSSQEEIAVGKKLDEQVVAKILSGETAEVNLNFGELTEPLLSVVVPWGKEDRIYGGIILHSPLTALNKTVQDVRETILWVTQICIVLCCGAAYYMSWSITRPLQQIERAASKIGMGDYSQRIETKHRDEIGELAATINQLAEKLEQSDKEKTRLEQFRLDFLANASHELRTPLTAMQGFLEALQDGLIDEQGRQKYYEIIYNETIHMNRLVDDIMDLTRLENNEIRLALQPVDAASLLKKVQFKFRHEAEERGNEIQLCLKEPLPPVIADPDRLEQILNNLVKNAVKFTENGLITISAEEDGDEVRIAIADTGIGISKADQELIWQRLFKVDRGRTSRHKGSGLGLAIVRQLAELHQARITVDSEIGQGAVFTLWMPKAKQAMKS
ncbi:two-component sensor histidine kinase [Insulibacter thermoxylanivorax]|uniref:histidine kinase n=1 Tax=Insulibacter thermoxylanivorax TaxID=2749268 RepID=A0A916VFA8_9BACL|nr:HAMP domain-containing sensor histidine kinase [Insulibacter thermoxylanivorax]GFR38107.1 two-component sensor histidine kinase [Insulibacter thermoxylanivorax]